MCTVQLPWAEHTLDAVPFNKQEAESGWQSKGSGPDDHSFLTLTDANIITL